MNRSVSYHLWLTVEPLYCSPKGFAFHATQNYVTYHSPTKRPLLSGILRNVLQDSGQLEQFRFAQHSYSSAHQFRRIESHFGCPRCLTLLTSLEYEHPLKSLNGIDVNKKHQRLGIPNSFMATAMASRAAAERTSSSKMFQTLSKHISSDRVVLGCTASGATHLSLHIIRVHSILYIYIYSLYIHSFIWWTCWSNLIYFSACQMLSWSHTWTAPSHQTSQMPVVSSGIEENIASIQSSPFTCMILDCPWRSKDEFENSVFANNEPLNASLGPGVLNGSIWLNILLVSWRNHLWWPWAVPNDFDRIPLGPLTAPRRPWPVCWASHGTWSSEGKHTSTYKKTK
jgi:hypothetical protein